jgi:hypothetical protein
MWRLMVAQVVESQRVVLDEIDALGDLGVHHLVDAYKLHDFPVFGYEFLDGLG